MQWTQRLCWLVYMFVIGILIVLIHNQKVKQDVQDEQLQHMRQLLLEKGAKNDR